MTLDTDVLIRFLVKDDPNKAKRFRFFLEKHKGLILTDVTVAEVFWVLNSFYQVNKTDIIDHLTTLISTPEISCNYSTLSLTLQILTTHNLSFVDAYVAASALTSKNKTIVSFDHDFNKITGLTRHEP